MRKAADLRFRFKTCPVFFRVFFRGAPKSETESVWVATAWGSRDTREVPGLAGGCPSAGQRRQGTRRCSPTSAGVRRAPEPSLQCGCTVRNSSGPGRTPALSPPAGQPATSAGERAGEAVGTVPHGTSHVLVGTMFTGHRSVHRAAGRKRAVDGGATVAVLGRNGGSSAAHCG